MQPIEDDVFKPIPWDAANEKRRTDFDHLSENKTYTDEDEKEISKFRQSVISLAQSVASLGNNKFKNGVYANGRKESFSGSCSSKSAWDDLSGPSIETSRTDSQRNPTHLETGGHTLDHIFPMPSVPHVLEEEESDTMSIYVKTKLREVCSAGVFIR